MAKISKRKFLILILILSTILTSFTPFNLISQAFNQDKLELIPLGNIAGIKLDTKGVLVIGIDENYLKYKDRNIKIGDIIVKIEGKEVNKAQDIEDITNDIKKDFINVTIKRDGKYISQNIKLYKNNEDDTYKIGVWVRDKIAGIGTLTCYNPKTKEFYALGHGITDVDTGSIIEVKNGVLYKPKKIGVKKGTSGVPGEIIGDFDKETIMGEFNHNDDFGIKGIMNNQYRWNDLKSIEVGHYYEVKKGDAYILFTDENNRIKRYKIKIKKIFNQNKPKSKSMVVEIVDKNLINYTGGIVQGMSGAPIIQNNKIIGAITHVFVNDPKKGYAIFIDWMLK
ncbi:SpoIVB peptidase [Tepidibacter hydrothermalis]|uniref:SpoIVB peptidase n=1 Tax=Tepidibacter hydrothermalis TaxID=3036126 RepID=A0ABY8EB75_9FIRM|nr:SpoIVB peptidase [Tepidibacter hydrothermalis]WFD09044.1 SpoIVB peptidase [Tepidibacter hydrothermalis]